MQGRQSIAAILWVGVVMCKIRGFLQRRQSVAAILWVGVTETLPVCRGKQIATLSKLVQNLMILMEIGCILLPGVTKVSQ